MTCGRSYAGKMEGVSAWVMLPTRPAVLQRIKLPKGGSARYFVGSSGSYHDAGDLPFSPTGYTILGEDGEYIRLASPVIQESGDAIVSSESPQYDVLVAAQLPPEFAVLAPDAAGPLCYYNQETDNVRISVVSNPCYASWHSEPTCLFGSCDSRTTWPTSKSSCRQEPSSRARNEVTRVSGGSTLMPSSRKSLSRSHCAFPRSTSALNF